MLAYTGILVNLLARCVPIQEDMREIKATLRRPDDKSAESRATMHKRLNEAVDRSARVESSVASVNEDVAEMTPAETSSAVGSRALKPCMIEIPRCAWVKRVVGLLIGRI